MNEQPHENHKCAAITDNSFLLRNSTSPEDEQAAQEIRTESMAASIIQSPLPLTTPKNDGAFSRRYRYSVPNILCLQGVRLHNFQQQRCTSTSTNRFTETYSDDNDNDNEDDDDDDDDDIIFSKIRSTLAENKAIHPENSSSSPCPVSYDSNDLSHLRPRPRRTQSLTEYNFEKAENFGGLGLPKNIRYLLQRKFVNINNAAHHSSDSSPLPRRKTVRFADSLGLELTTVRELPHCCCETPGTGNDHHQLCALGSPPKVPPKVIDALRLGAAEYHSQAAEPFAGVPRNTTPPMSTEVDCNYTWKPLFEDPLFSVSNFDQQVSDNKIKLESAKIEGLRMCLTVRLVNLSFEKRVFMRLTHDNWRSSRDYNLGFLQSLTRLGFDQFFGRCYLLLPREVTKVEFCVAYQMGPDDIFWDNNNGRNYSFQEQASLY